MAHGFGDTPLLTTVPMNATVPSWLNAQGASPNLLKELESAVDALPPSYLKLLSLGNGGEVKLIADPFNFCLDSVESALDYWRSGTYTMSGVFIFGCSGGGDSLAFDMRVLGQRLVVCFDPIDPEGSISVVAPDFDGLLALVADKDV